MKNFEQLLSNYDFILNLLHAGFTVKQITQEISSQLRISITYGELLYLIKRVKLNTIHREYDSIVMVDILKDASDKNLSNYCIVFHGLWITYKAAAHLTNSAYIITQANLLTIYDKEALLYAKRILKLYHISDMVLLEQHKQKYPTRPDINLNEFTHKIHVSFNDEFNAMLSNLRKKYVHFLTNNLKEKANAKEKGI